ncbi:MAG: nucleotidyl transferase AbiEii/AbiGii toxin family protein [Steroidobacterales bacterium]
MTASYPAFEPRLEILPPAQRWPWSRLGTFSTQGFVLYGGTAIALRLGHRSSEDFDFFTDKQLDKAAIRNALPSAHYEVLQDIENTYTLLINGPVSEEAAVKLSCFGGLTFGRFGQPTIAAASQVAVASLDDLLATTLAAVLLRVEAKDYRDLAALLRAGLSLARGLAIASEMYGPQFPAAQCVKTLTYFKGGDLAELPDVDRTTLRSASAAVDGLPQVSRLSSTLGIAP